MTESLSDSNQGSDRPANSSPKTESSTEARKWTQFVAASIASLTAFIFGQMVSWSAPVTPILIKHKEISKDEESWLVSILNVGAFAGCIICGYLHSHMGRKTILLVLCVPLMISWALLAFGKGILILCLGRLIGGICTGVICVTTPMFITEIAQPSIRGALATLFQLSITIGILFTFTLGLLKNALWITIASSVIVILFGALFFIVPESPIYLLIKGQSEEAAASLRWFRGQKYDSEGELEQMKALVRESSKNKASYADFKKEGTLKALIIMLGLFFFQQMAGINTVIFYTNTIFEAAGSTMSPTLSSIIIGIVQVLATALSVYLIDKAGRRFLLLLSLISLAVCLFVLGLYFFLKSHQYDVSSIGWLPLVSVSAYLVLFAMGMGPVPWAMIGELFNKNISSLAMSAVTAIHWLLAFGVTKSYSMFELWLGTGPTFWMYAVFCILGAVFCYVIVPETKGRDIQDILHELKGKPKTERSSTIA